VFLEVDETHTHTRNPCGSGRSATFRTADGEAVVRGVTFTATARRFVLFAIGHLIVYRLQGALEHSSV